MIMSINQAFSDDELELCPKQMYIYKGFVHENTAPKHISTHFGSR